MSFLYHICLICLSSLKVSIYQTFAGVSTDWLDWVNHGGSWPTPWPVASLLFGQALPWSMVYLVQPANTATWNWCVVRIPETTQMWQYGYAWSSGLSDICILDFILPGAEGWVYGFQRQLLFCFPITIVYILNTILTVPSQAKSGSYQGKFMSGVVNINFHRNLACCII